MRTYIFDFLTHPIRTGSIAPSSRFVARSYVDLADISHRKHIVELGPAAGCITHSIAPVLSPDQSYLAVEINERFVDQFRDQFPKLSIRHGSAECMSEYLASANTPYSDCVISGVPWTNFKASDRQRILSKVFQSMAPGGIFLTIAYFYSPWLPTGSQFRKELHDQFGNFQSSKLIMWNLPPAYIYYCYKQ